MSEKVYGLSYPAQEVDLIVLDAGTPEEAAIMLGARVVRQIQNKVWEIAFSPSLFQPRQLEDRERMDEEGEWWYYDIPRRDGAKGHRIFLDMSMEVEPVHWLWELPVAAALSLEAIK